jgi:hypothetical protein
MRRRRFLALTGAFALGYPRVGSAVTVPDLLDRLEKDLRPRLPRQFAFLRRVIVLVENDQIPLSLVERIYLWARKKPRNQFQYFEAALRTEAGKRGVAI